MQVRHCAHYSPPSLPANDHVMPIALTQHTHLHTHKADGNIKLCDLGISRQQPGLGEAENAGTMSATMTIGVGTVQYMPPELLSLGPHTTMAQLLAEGSRSDDEHLSEGSHRVTGQGAASAAPRYDGRKWDVYGLAMIVAYLWGGGTLYPGLTPFQVAAAVAAGARPRLSSSMPAALQELVVAMWDADPKQRPSCAEVARQLDQRDLRDAVKEALREDSDEEL
mgnify:FL=1